MAAAGRGQGAEGRPSRGGCGPGGRSGRRGGTEPRTLRAGAGRQTRYSPSHVARAGLPGALKSTGEEGKPTRSTSRTPSRGRASSARARPSPGTTLPTPASSPAGAHAPGRLLASVEAPGVPAPASEGSARQSLCARPGAPVRPSWGDGLLRSAAPGAVRAAAAGHPCRAFRRECLGSGGIRGPSSISDRAGTLSQSQSLSRRSSHPSPLGSAGFGNTQAEHPPAIRTPLWGRQSSSFVSGHEGLS